jgi:hypothetical protein
MPRGSSTSSGPPPQRNSQRRRANKPKSHGAAEPVMTEAAAFRPELGIESPTPQIQGLWDALQISAESRFYSDADWHRVRIELAFGDGLVRRLLDGEPVSATRWQQFQNALTELLVSPAAKRRAGIETRPVVDAQGDAAEAKIFELAAKLKA